ncbi:MAG TPA: FecR domain-containing protein, partial [Anseongella sp.]|nr:FecR domain-containing protein [Anseongella sp.]
VFTGIFVLGGAAYRLFIHKPLVVHSTGYGEIATVWLPDSSKVILNGNSSISYSAGWNERSSREVLVKGEAFFRVRHTSDDRKFTVKTSRDFDVEVLGTEFSVYDREQASRVVLNSGKVQLNFTSAGEWGSVNMLPGELVELRGTGNYRKRKVNPSLYSSWIDKKILLENTSFREIKLLLEETYGLPVAVHDTSLYNERFSGTVPSENVQVLMKALAISFGLAIEIENNQVLFKPKQ